MNDQSEELAAARPGKARNGQADGEKKRGNEPLTFLREMAGWSPVYAFMLLFFLGRDLYITALGIHVRAVLLYLFGGVLLLVSVKSHPLEEECRRFPLDLVRDCLPILLVGMLFFAEAHFVPAVVLLLLPAAAAILWLFVRRRYWLRHIHGKKTAKKRAKTDAGRLFVVLLFLLLLIPSVLGFAHAKDPTGRAELPLADPIERNAARLEGLSSFTELGKKEKLELAQAIADAEAENLGILPVVVREEGLSRLVAGEYRRAGRVLCVDSETLSDPDVARFVDTVCHEMRHAFQDDTVYLLVSLPPFVRESAYFDEARAWEYNLTHYVTVDAGAEQYFDQPLEQDAREYALSRLPAYQQKFFADAAGTEEQG